MDVSAEDTKLVRQVWSVVGSKLKENGVAFFVALFTKYPEYQGHFAAFKGMQLKQASETGKMRAHGSSVMHLLSNLVENLDDPDCFVCLVQKAARDHKPRNVDAKYFEVALAFLIQFLGDNFGSQWSPQAKTAWEKVVKSFLGIYDKEYSSL